MRSPHMHVIHTAIVLQEMLGIQLIYGDNTLEMARLKETVKANGIVICRRLIWQSEFTVIFYGEIIQWHLCESVNKIR